MSAPPVAISARVSSDQPAEAPTVASQVAAWRERGATEGLAWPDARPFLAEGSRGATLIRPALERWREGIAARAVERLSRPSPDRCARPQASHVLVGEECRRAGVEGICLHRALGQSPEDARLLQGQGMLAAYARATSIERPRRGTRQAAPAGVVHGLSGAPEGDRQGAKEGGGGQAREESVPDEARLVRPGFAGVGRDRPTIGEVCRWLTRAGEVPRPGKTGWDRRRVWGL